MTPKRAQKILNFKILWRGASVDGILLHILAARW